MDVAVYAHAVSQYFKLFCSSRSVNVNRSNHRLLIILLQELSELNSSCCLTSTLETVKHYRQSKVYPLVDKLRQWLLALYRKYLDLKQDYRELRQKFSRVSQERSYYEERANNLSNENYRLRESAQDLSRVRRALGDEAVDDAIGWAKDREMAEALAPQGSQKPVIRTVQDRSDWEAR